MVVMESQRDANRMGRYSRVARHAETAGTRSGTGHCTSRARGFLKLLRMTQTLFGRRPILVLALLSIVGAPTVTMAQDYPSRPIRLILPYPPGGTADALVRPLAQHLTNSLGQPVVVVTQPGANGIVGSTVVANSPADGYTLLIGAIGPFSVLSAMQKMPFDPVNDFSPVSFLATVPNILVVNPSLPVKSVSEFVAYAKSRSGEIVYGSGGTGGSNHLATELFRLAIGVPMRHVAYKGGAPAEMDLLGGHITLIFDNLPAAIPHIKSGGFRALAVTSLRRQSTLPDIPTMNESGFPGFEAGSWFGVLAPARTPRPIVERLNRAILAAMNEPELRKTYLNQGFDLNPGSPEDFAAFIRSETTKWHRVVAEAGIKGE